MGMGIGERAERLAVRKDYMTLWQTSLMDTMKTDCRLITPSPCFLNGSPNCISFALRKRALHNEMSRYQCCAGYMPCSGKCQENKCPTFCLCMEVSCCFSSSVQSTRYLIQDEYNIKTTKCDNCLIAFMVILAEIACICHLVACLTGNSELEDLAEILTCISDLVYCTVCACMQTQHKLELDHRHSIPWGDPGVMMVPAVQEMSRFDQAVPPTVRQPLGLPPGQLPPVQQPLLPPGQYPPGQYPPAQQQGQWQQQQPPYGCAYPPPYMPAYPANPQQSPPPGYAASGYPLPPPGYYPPGSQGPGYYPPGCPPPPQHFPSDEHPQNPPLSPPPPPAQAPTKPKDSM
ncbi:hypothetical protein V6Z12_A07G162900 [Gossypium hirsutum]